jgi:hypothetical protein
VTKLKNLFLVDDVLVEAVLSKGGGFYDLTIVPTGDTIKVNAKVFLETAKSVKVNDDDSK